MFALLSSLLLLQGVPSVAARPVQDFLNSIGANSAIDKRGESLEQTIRCAKYVGIKWFRGGIEGDPSLENLIRVHRETGARFSWSPGSGGSDLPKLLATARVMAKAGALLSFEGPNEPNNWGITYNGEQGGHGQSWLPVAKFQRDLYQSVKSDPLLKNYPVFGISEDGAETDNVGLQFLKIPAGAETLLPAGTQFADFANVHNYIYHPNSPNPTDNKTWNASAPGPECKVDGLYGEYGLTWAKHFAGYSGAALENLPRVTTETGCLIEGEVTEEVQAKNILTLYLDQFKRGWSFTALYLLRDRVDEGGNQRFGFYRPDYSTRKSADYLHNLTTILADKGTVRREGKLAYRILESSPTVHDLLLQKADGTFELIVWSELVKGSQDVHVTFGRALKHLNLYDPTVSVTPQLLNKNLVTIPLHLSDHPVVLEIRS